MKKKVIIFLVITMICLGLHGCLEQNSLKKSDTLPDFTEKTLKEAIRQMEELDLQYKLIEVESGDEVEYSESYGVVVGQKPAPGDQLSPGEKITLYVSKKIKVPKLVGLPLKDAMKRINNTPSLLLGRKILRELPAHFMMVISQVPPPGTICTPPVEVTLHIAIPPALPQLTEKVREILREMGIPEEKLDFVVRGQLNYRISTRAEDTGTVYICSLDYSIWAFSSTNNFFTMPIIGSVEKWAYDRKRAREFALKEAAENVAKYVAPKIYPEFEQSDFLSTLDRQGKDWWERIKELSKEIDKLEGDLLWRE